MALQGVSVGLGSRLAGSLQRLADPGASTSRVALRSSNQSVSFTRDRIDVSLAGRIAGRAAALGRGSANSSEAVSLLQVADTALGAMAEKLARLNELADQANLAKTSDSERAVLNAEFSRVRAEIIAIADDTEFNSVKILKGGTALAETRNVASEVNTTTFTANNGSENLTTAAGIQQFVFAADAPGVLDGDVFRVEYDAASKNFTVTNTRSGVSQTVAAPSQAALDAIAGTGNAVDVTASTFGLTIKVISTFDRGQDNKALAGASVQNEFTVSAKITTTLSSNATAGTSDVVNFSFNIGGGTGPEDTVSFALQAATLANLAPGLASDDISTAAGAATAVANTVAASHRLNEDRELVRGFTTRFQIGAGNLGDRAAVDAAMEAEGLSRDLTIDLSLFVAEELLSQGGVVPEIHDAALARDILAVLDTSPPALPMSQADTRSYPDDASQANDQPAARPSESRKPTPPGDSGGGDSASGSVIDLSA